MNWYLDRKRRVRYSIRLSKKIRIGPGMDFFDNGIGKQEVETLCCTDMVAPDNDNPRTLILICQGLDIFSSPISVF